MLNFTHDGHVHTPFCPHGTNDPLESYIHQAIAKGLKTITFTEHAPLPESFVDPTPDQDSAMSIDMLPEYFDTLRHLKETYQNEIEIRSGLEIDYLPGLENETISLLEPFAPMIDEAILSQHFLYIDQTYMPVDFSAELFERLVEKLGSFEEVLRMYYSSLESGLDFPWERLHIKRIGHLDLPIKYQRNYEWSRSDVTETQSKLLQAISNRGFGLDFNTAGLRKPDCGAAYIEEFVKEALSFHIPLTLGSDAHLAQDVGADFDTIQQKKATFL
ncbi:histidinol-phosphatase HisJ [Exiguobacterium algae]|uniref:histidinol-phosphatase HisJ n=1 Tax=Exiguobacterium algae TaxID=2751250 RepID=UPI001BE7475A|nr:histidinol-phosphatase HisJ [Exiguobacterium algae]